MKATEFLGLVGLLVISIGLVIVLVLYVVRANPNHDTIRVNNAVDPNTIVKYQDKDYQVTCWLYADNAGVAISCLPEQQLQLRLH